MDSDWRRIHLSQQQAKKQKQKDPLRCRECDEIIVFDPKHRKPDGVGWVRLNPDKSIHECKPKKDQTQPQQQQPTATVQSSPTTTRSNNNTDEIAILISQLKAEIRVYFEHINLRLDKIQELSNQRK